MDVSVVKGRRNAILSEVDTLGGGTCIPARDVEF